MSLNYFILLNESTFKSDKVVLKNATCMMITKERAKESEDCRQAMKANAKYINVITVFTRAGTEDRIRRTE